MKDVLYEVRCYMKSNEDIKCLLEGVLFSLKKTLS